MIWEKFGQDKSQELTHYRLQVTKVFLSLSLSFFGPSRVMVCNVLVAHALSSVLLRGYFIPYYMN